jgi:hypothetical protein
LLLCDTVYCISFRFGFLFNLFFWGGTYTGWLHASVLQAVGCHLISL